MYGYGWPVYRRPMRWADQVGLKVIRKRSWSWKPRLYSTCSWLDLLVRLAEWGEGFTRAKQGAGSYPLCDGS